MTAHTPTPWTLTDRGHAISINGAPHKHTEQPNAIDATTVATIRKGSEGTYTFYPSDTAEANAAFIVKAANNFESLVKALEEAEAEINVSVVTRSCRTGGSKTLELVRAALAGAKKGEGE